MLHRLARLDHRIAINSLVIVQVVSLVCILVRFRQRAVREAVEAGFAVPALIATEQRMMHVQICC